MFRKLLCLILCLCLFVPSLALAQQDVTGLRFDLRFQMDPAAFPQGNEDILSGLADLINIISLKGTLDQSFTGCFDMNAQLMLADAGETLTDVRIFGTESTWDIQSSLLGGETLMVNLIALPEFAMKTYFRLDVPLQQASLLISPYVHKSALDSIISAWSAVMHAKEGKRTIPRQQVLALAQHLADIAATDPTFHYWVQALALESGYDEAIQEAMAALPEWSKEVIGSNGVSITTKGSTETWRTGKTTLFTRTVEDSVTAWSVTPPTTANGYDVAIYYHGQPDSERTLQISITDPEKASVLDCTVTANNLPDLQSEMPISAPFSLQVDATGLAVGDGLHLLFEGEGSNGYFTLSMLEPATRAPQLTLSGTLIPYTPNTTPDFTWETLNDSVNLLSVNEETLSALMHSIGRPLVKGAIPLLLHTPAASVQSLLDLLTDSGILAMLLSGSTPLTDAALYD